MNNSGQNDSSVDPIDAPNNSGQLENPKSTLNNTDNVSGNTGSVQPLETAPQQTDHDQKSTQNEKGDVKGQLTYESLVDKLRKGEIQLTDEMKILLNQLIHEKEKASQLEEKIGKSQQQQEMDNSNENQHETGRNLNQQEGDDMVDDNLSNLSEEDKKNIALQAFMASTEKKLDNFGKVIEGFLGNAKTPTVSVQSSRGKPQTPTIESFVSLSSKDSENNKGGKFFEKKLAEMQKEIDFLKNKKNPIEKIEQNTFKNSNSQQTPRIMNNNNNNNGNRKRKETESFSPQDLRKLISRSNPSSFVGDQNNSSDSISKNVYSSKQEDTFGNNNFTSPQPRVNPLHNSDKLPLFVKESPFYKLAMLNSHEEVSYSPFVDSRSVKSSSEYKQNSKNLLKNELSDLQKTNPSAVMEMVVMALANQMRNIPPYIN